MVTVVPSPLSMISATRTNVARPGAVNMAAVATAPATTTAATKKMAPAMTTRQARRPLEGLADADVELEAVITGATVNGRGDVEAYRPDRCEVT